MNYYFCADYPSTIKLNGVYYGTISETIKNITIEQEFVFLEVLPLVPEQHAINFMLDAQFLSCPPPNVCVTDLKGGYLIKFLKTYTGGEFKVLAQEKYSDLLVTVFNDNGKKLSIETQADFYAEPVSLELSNITFHRPKFCHNLLAVAFKNKKTLLNVYDVSNKVSKVFSRLVDEFTLDDCFTTTECFLDMAKHKLTCSWVYQGSIMQEKERSVTKSERFNASTLPEKLLPFAFLEEFLVKGNFTDYLSGSVLENASKLGGFLGNYVGVMPPPIFRNIEEVGLIYHTGNNCYSVEYFTFETIDGKIRGIKKCE